MADTIITTPPASSDSGAGWAVAFVIILAVVLVGGFFVYKYRFAGGAPSGGTNINVTIPTPTTGGSAPGGASQ